MNCQICEETVDKLFKHHVTPKSKGGTHGETVLCCSTCAKQVHILFNNKELAKMTLDELRATEQMIKYVKWKKKHPGYHKGRMSNKVKDWKRYHR